MMQMLNDNIQHTLHFIDNLFSTKIIQSRCVEGVLAMVFALVNNWLVYKYQLKAILLGVVVLYPNVFLGIPLLINLSVMPTQSLGKVLNRSSLIAIFFFFSLFCTVGFNLLNL